jgi:hypothetical protein
LSLARLSVAAVALAAVSALHAAPVVFYGQDLTPNNMVSGAPLSAHNDFVDLLTNVKTETFTDRTVDASSPLGIFYNGSGKTATLTGGGEVAVTSANDAGRFNTTSATTTQPRSGQWWDTNASTVTITFDSPISAFGFYGTDFGDFDGRVSVTLTDRGNSINSSLSILTCPTTGCTTGSDNAALIFWGFYDTQNTYTKIEFSNASSGTDYFGFDDMVVGDVGQVSRIPEPATLALAGLGLIGLAATRRKQRH